MIDQTSDVDKLREKESFWQNKLDTFQQNELDDDCEVALL